jgi:hypothetical protein
VETEAPLATSGPVTEACLKRVAEAILARPEIVSVTVAARVPDADRLDGKGLAAARTAADLLVSAGLPRTRVSAVAPPARAGEAPGLQIAYIERPAQRPVARLHAAEGEVLAGPGGTAVQPVRKAAGDLLYAGDVLQTGPRSRAGLALADGSTLWIAARSEVRLGTIALGANLKRQVEIELAQGNVEVNATAGGDGSVFEIKTRNAAAVVRGTELRVAAGDETSRVETLGGKAALAAAGREVEVAGGFGSRAVREGAPEAPRPLLPAPKVKGPYAGQFRAPPTLTWEAVPGADAYRLELARTADFSVQYEEATSRTAEITTGALAAGKWFWRVLPIDAQGFVGFPSKIHAFDLQPASP